MSAKFVSETHPIEHNAVIGARKTTKDGTKLKWQMRYYCPVKKSNIYRQLKLDYEEGSRSNLSDAIKKARVLYQKLDGAAKATGDATGQKTLRVLLLEFLDDVERKVEINEGLVSKGRPPIHYIPKGREDSYWRNTTLAYYRPLLRDAVIPFFIDEGVYDMETYDIDLWRVEGFALWIYENLPEKSPTYIAYGIALIRQIFRYGYQYKNAVGDRVVLVKGIPSPDRPVNKYKQRARRNLKQKEYNKILDGVDEECNRLKLLYQETELDFHKDRYDRYYQFWLFLRIIIFCGYRPSGGEVEHTVLKLNDFVITNKGTDKEKRFIKRTEKNKVYQAPLLPEAWVYHDALLKFHELNGNVYNKDTGEWSLTPYAFFHTGNYKSRYSRGDKIKTFRHLWYAIIDKVGIDNPVGAPANERLVPYSLRGYFITMRLRNSSVDIGKLSKSVGTSTRMIEQTYYDFIISSEWDTLTGSDNEILSRRKGLLKYL